MNIPDSNRLEIFTFSNDDNRRQERYDAQCPNNYCDETAKNLNDQLGRTGSRSKLILECDEFPWKSSEQGGRYMDQFGSGRRTNTCIPKYQNNWHGQCLRMLGQMQSNWAKLEPEPDTDNPQGDYWLKWGGKERGVNTWVTPGEHGPVGSKYMQRLKEYPTTQPMPDGVTLRDNDKISWVFRRDYQVSWLNQGTVSGSDWWDARRWNYVNTEKYGTDTMGADSIICAVNNFGQDDVYMYPVSKGKEYNGICYHTTSSPTNGYFAKDGSYTFCKVDFAPPATSGGTTKRDWTVTNVTSVDVSLDDLADD